MRTHHLHCKIKHKFKITTDLKHDLLIAPNLLNRNFEMTKPNQVYVGDMIYIWTQEGWLNYVVIRQSKTTYLYFF